ncbi:DUF6636 domain-containing protein [Mycobacterium sp. IEC1808]|uniref:DUF6636 domain-containing protein n=1 Tax=Mycobacterium sp. IEC1808 TaxID=1743230 RepID=UPI0011530A1C|nr:DUF6636 domain-containing protein [Mycobacterium sp. IEC1808]
MRKPTAAVSLTLAAMVLSPFAPTAHAEPYYAFQSPSGNVYCGLGQSDATTFAACEIRDHTWPAPPRPNPCMGGWGDRISMRQGGAPQMSCHTDTLKDPSSPVLEYGQTRSLNSLECDSEASGMTCTDTSSGHYFRLSRDNYELH